MNGFLKWLGRRLFGKKPARQNDLYRTGRRISPARPPYYSEPKKIATRRHAPRKPARPQQPLDYVADDFGSAANDASGEHIALRNRFVREDTGTHETLRIFDETVLETKEEQGFDPYNTGRFDRSKHWDKRTRE